MGRYSAQWCRSHFGSQPTLLSRRHNLPVALTAVIGREQELAQLGTLLLRADVRLVTLTGPGGIGKTRLALAAATEHFERFAHGAAFVPLAAISSPTLLAQAIIAALDVPLQGQRNPRDQLLDYLGKKELLLVLDNVEQLLAPELPQTDLSDHREGVAELLLDVLRYAPGVTLLVTSRERLAVYGEWLFDLPGLSYPLSDSADAIEMYSAVQLFVQRALQVRRQFTLAAAESLAVARICRLVEGLPLAIELAAAALRSHSCSAIASALETNLAALAADLRLVPERHRSTWATFEHSWNLLADAERQIFRRLAVFRGGFQENAAVAVAEASPQLLAALVDKSLLRWDGVARYDLHELVRQYAGEKLEQSGETVATRRAHASYFSDLAQSTEPKLRTSEQALWLERLEAEHDNLRAALRWAIDGLEIESGLRLAGALGWFWYVHDHFTEGRAWLDQLLAFAETHSAAAIARVKALNVAAALARVQEDSVQAAALLAASLALAQEIGDSMGVAWSLQMHGLMAWAQGDYAQAVMRSEQSLGLYRQLGESWGIAASLLSLGTVMREQKRYAQATAYYAESEKVFQAAGDQRGIAFALREQGIMAETRGDYDRASDLFGKSLQLFRELAERSGIAWSCFLLRRVARQQGDDIRAAALFEESLALYQKLGDSKNSAFLETFIKRL